MKFASLVGPVTCWILFGHRAGIAASRPKKIPAPIKAAPLPPEKLRGQIAYVQNGDLWVVQPDTQKKTLLFRGRSFQTDFRDTDWNSDLSQVAFSRRTSEWVDPEKGNGGKEIFVMSWDGKQGRQLTNTGFYELSQSPRWSPDGKLIAFEQQEGYRMGGPGLATSSLGVVDVSSAKVIQQISFGDRETASLPQWSWDQKSLLLSVRSGSSDSNEGDGIQHLVELKLDSRSSDHRDFNGEFWRFDARGVSRDKTRFAQVVDVVGDHIARVRYSPRDTEGAGVVGSSMGLYAIGNELDGISFDATGMNVAFSAVMLNVSFNAKGQALFPRYYSPNPSPDLWTFPIYAANGKTTPHILVHNARFLKWL